MFTKGFGIKSDSPFHGKLKDRKIMKKPKVQAESLKLKMKDIIKLAMEEAGNPVSFDIIQ